MDAQALHNTITTAGPSNGTNRTTQTQTQTQAQTPPGSTLIYRTPSRTVRSNWIYYLRESWQTISQTSKVILGTTLLIGFVQIIVTIAILIIGKNEICDKPLDIYLIVFLVRLGFSLPLTLYQYLRPSGLNGRNNRSLSTTATISPSSIANSACMTLASQDRNRNIASPSLSSTPVAPNAPEDTLSINSHPISPDQESSTATSSSIQHPPYRSTIMQSSWLDRFKSLLDLLSILWFVVGNYMVFTASEQCHRDAKYLFYTTMTWILLGYFLVLIPLLLCVSVVFCLPCLLVAMRVMNVDYATGMVGANKNEIEAIPVYKYKPSSAIHCQDAYHVPSSTHSSPLPPSPLPPSSLSACVSSSAEKKKKPGGIVSHFISSYHNKHRYCHDNDDEDEQHTATGDDEEAGLKEWTMDPTDASCTICLCDYEHGNLVCRLRCGHHFHKDCVHEWLSLNYKCPLCQRDFRRNKDDDDEIANGV